MIKRFTDFLGPERTRALFLLIALTGLTSLVLNAVQGEAMVVIQSLLALIAIVGSITIILTKLERDDRLRWTAILVPAAVAVVIGVFFVQSLSLLFFGLAAGWIIAGMLLFRARGPMHYREAVKHLRKNNYEAAVKAMDSLIKAEPTAAQHYHFRAQILRVWGKLDRAKRDYKEYIRLAPEEAKAVGYNSLAELLIQTRSYDEALEAAQEAATRAPDQWEALYNLGIIEDRLGRSAEVVTHLTAALKQRIQDVRHRFLIHLYLARAQARLGDLAAAEREVAEVKKLKSGLKDWKTLLESDQAQTLRAVLGTDVQQAEGLINGTLTASALAGTER